METFYIIQNGTIDSTRGNMEEAFERAETLAKNTGQPVTIVKQIGYVEIETKVHRVEQP